MIYIGLALVVLIVIGIVWYGHTRAPADRRAMAYPVAARFVAGKRVRVQVVLVGSVNPPGKAIDRAIEGFGKYVSGTLERMPEIRAPHATVKWPDVRNQPIDVLLGQAFVPGPSDIVIAVYPEIPEFPYRGISIPRSDGDQLILIDEKRANERNKTWIWNCSKLVLSRQIWWELLVKHEMLHALRLPADPGRRCNGFHCTSPACILYPTIDLRSACRTLANFGPPMDLCRDCQQDVRDAQQAAKARSPDGIEGLDKLAEMNALVELNPNNGLAYSFRGEEFYSRKQYDEALKDQNRAVELEPNQGRMYAERGFTYRAKGDGERMAKDWLTCIKLGDDASAARKCLRNLTGMAIASLRDPSQPQYWPAVAGVARELCQIAGIAPAIAEEIQSAIQNPSNMPAAVDRFEAAMTALPDFKK